MNLCFSGFVQMEILQAFEYCHWLKYICKLCKFIINSCCFLMNIHSLDTDFVFNSALCPIQCNCELEP